MSMPASRGQVAGTHWDPLQYLKFTDHRLRPALELLDRVHLDDPRVIYDLGCGPGQITRLIAEQWQSATVYGLDNSPEMLVQAQALAKAFPSLQVAYKSGDLQAQVASAQPHDLVMLAYVLSELDEAAQEALLAAAWAKASGRGCSSPIG